MTRKKFKKNIWFFVVGVRKLMSGIKRRRIKHMKQL